MSGSADLGLLVCAPRREQVPATPGREEPHVRSLAQPRPLVPRERQPLPDARAAETRRRHDPDGGGAASLTQPIDRLVTSRTIFTILCTWSPI